MDFSRREFLKVSGAVLGVTALAMGNLGSCKGANAVSDTGPSLTDLTYQDSKVPFFLKTAEPIHRSLADE